MEQSSKLKGLERALDFAVEAEKVAGEFYGLLKLVCIGLIGWNAVQLVLHYFLKREVRKNGIAKEV